MCKTVVEPKIIELNLEGTGVTAIAWTYRCDEHHYESKPLSETQAYYFAEIHERRTGA